MATGAPAPGDAGKMRLAIDLSVVTPSIELTSDHRMAAASSECRAATGPVTAHQHGRDGGRRKNAEPIRRTARG